jgi:hypothetical protein
LVLHLHICWTKSEACLSTLISECRQTNCSPTIQILYVGQIVKRPYLHFLRKPKTHSVHLRYSLLLVQGHQIPAKGSSSNGMWQCTPCHTCVPKKLFNSGDDPHTYCELKSFMTVSRFVLGYSIRVLVFRRISLLWLD